MKIVLLCAGRVREKYYRDAIQEYVKRLSRYCRFEIREVEDGPDPASELARFEKKLSGPEGAGAYLTALSSEGRQYTSLQMAQRLEELMLRGTQTAVFIIGGSDGIDKRLKERSNEIMSFSKLTFPHQMMRMIFVEQLYRCFRIIAGEPYHK